MNIYVLYVFIKRKMKCTEPHQVPTPSRISRETKRSCSDELEPAADWVGRFFYASAAELQRWRWRKTGLSRRLKLYLFIKPFIFCASASVSPPLSAVGESQVRHWRTQTDSHTGLCALMPSCKTSNSSSADVNRSWHLETFKSFQ